MTDTQFHIIFAVLALVPFVQYFWYKAFEPMRGRLFQQEKAVLSSSDWSSDEQKSLKRFTHYGCGWLLMFTCAVAVTPFMVQLIFASFLGVKSKTKAGVFEKLAESKEGKVYHEMHTRCMLMSNPIFAFLFLAQLLPLSIILFLIKRGWESTKNTIERDVVGAVASSRRFSSAS